VVQHRVDGVYRVIGAAVGTTSGSGAVRPDLEPGGEVIDVAAERGRGGVVGLAVIAATAPNRMPLEQPSRPPGYTAGTLRPLVPRLTRQEGISGDGLWQTHNPPVVDLSLTRPAPLALVPACGPLPDFRPTLITAEDGAR